jgi:hypothetical protein
MEEGVVLLLRMAGVVVGRGQGTGIVYTRALGTPSPHGMMDAWDGTIKQASCCIAQRLASAPDGATLEDVHTPATDHGHA